MKTTGYKLREAIRRWELRRDTAAKQFDSTKWRFPSEDDQPLPQEVTKIFLEAEDAIAKLQSAQAVFNLAVKVDVRGTSMTLCEVVKRIGGAGRVEKMWRSYASDTGKDKYSYRQDLERDPTKEQARRAVPVKECMNQATELAKQAGALRAALATANATEIDIPGLDPALFE